MYNVCDLSAPKIDNPSPTIGRRILAGVKIGFTPIALGCICYFGWHNSDTLANAMANALPGNLGFAILMWAGLHFLSPIFAVVIFGGCGSSVSYRVSFKTHAGCLPARYMPGGIWHTVARVMDYHGQGISGAHLTAFVFLENILAPAVTFLLGGAAVFFYRGWDSWGIVGITGLVSGAIAMFLAPAIINRWVLKGRASLPLAAYAKSVGIVIVFWCIAAGAFVMYLLAFPAAMQGSSPIEVGGTYLFSWGIGYAAVFAPQGIGVFEVVVGDMLQAPIALGGLVALVAGFRVVILAADFMVWGLSQLVGTRWCREVLSLSSKGC